MASPLRYSSRYAQDTTVQTTLARQMGTGAPINARPVAYRTGQVLLRTVHYSSSSPDVVEFEAKFLKPKGLEYGRGSVEFPIMLTEGVSAFNFKNFLRALYGTVDYGEGLTFQAWLAILDLCISWHLISLRHHVVTEIEARFPHIISQAINQVVYGQAYEVAHWFKQGCFELTTRERHMVDEEKCRLDRDTYAHLLELREKYIDVRIRVLRGMLDDHRMGPSTTSAQTQVPFNFDDAYLGIFGLSVRRALT
ncbi:unnamed protein product [Peniophora sp. CBMAI 1063]|nr:unnamed protein product [Peniophora sp. CBMAI 1063]